MIDRNEIDKRAYISSFDGLRAVAIIAIIAHHLMAYRFPGGFLGIDIFLILAGYLMTNQLMTLLMQRGKVPLRTFLVSRLKRVMVPMMAMLFSVMGYVMIFQRELLTNLRSSVVTSFFFVTNWWQIVQESGQATPILTSSPFENLWFVSLLFQYYLLWPIIFVFLSVLLKQHRHLVRVIVGLTGIFAIWMMVVSLRQTSFLRVLYGTDTRMFSIAIGACCALIVPVERFRQDKPQTRRRLFVEILPIFLLLASFFLFTDQGSWTYRGGLLVFDGIVAAVLVFSLHPSSKTSIFFRLKPLTVIGRRSLSYFLWYVPVSVLFQAKLGDTSGNPWLYTLLEVLLILGMGEIWYRLFEKRYYRRLTGQQEVKTPRIQPLGYVVLVIFVLITFFQTTATVSSDEAAIENTVTSAQSVADGTLSTGRRLLQTINNVPGLTREETVFSSNASVTVIGDTSLLAMAQKLPTIYPNVILSANRQLQVYEMGAQIATLKQNNQLGDSVVLMVGTNGPFSQGQLDRVLKQIGMDKQIFLVTTTVNRTWQAQNNRHMAAEGALYSNVHVLDWATASQSLGDIFYMPTRYVNETGATQQSIWIAKNIYQTLRGS